MTPKNGVNGKHEDPKYIFNFNGRESAVFRKCPRLDCNKDIFVTKESYYTNLKYMKCDDDHPYQVWHNPETKTYMVSCD